MKKIHFFRVALFILMDAALMMLSWVASIWLYSYLFRVPEMMLSYVLTYFPVLIVINMFVFYLYGVYKNMWLYASIPDLVRITFASATANFLIYCFFKIATGAWQSPAIGMMAFFLLLTFSGGVRLLPRITSEFKLYVKRSDKYARRVLIVGAGHSASMLIREMRLNTKAYSIVGIVDDDPNILNLRMHNAKVLGPFKAIPEIADRLGVQEILIAIPSASKSQLNKIISYCPLDKCKVRLINSINAAQTLQGLSDLNYADLLGREETQLNVDEISKMVANEVVLVTGGGGSIGSELVRQLLNYDVAKIIVYDIYENNTFNLIQELKLTHSQYADLILAKIGDIQDIERLEAVINEYKPAVVFHAAAYKHVPLMEECPELAVKNNVFGTNILARLSLKHGVKKFVMISTDKAVNPTSIMGASKRLAERVVLSLNNLTSADITIGSSKYICDKQTKTEFVCVRFGNVLGSNGSVVPVFQRQIESGGPITVTHPEITRYFMTIPEAASLVIQAACMAQGGEIFILDMGKPVKIVDLANTMIRVAGLIPDVDIKIEFTGLRPGEKLYEELLINLDEARKTDNDRIYVANLKTDTGDYIDEMLKLLSCAIENNDIVACAAKLEHTFQPQTDNDNRD